jgi:hypothetical protein
MRSNDEKDSTFSRHAAAYVLPATLAACAYLAQSNYAAIKAQLDRIEARQRADIVTLTELQIRVLQLERFTGNNARPQQYERPAELSNK